MQATIKTSLMAHHFSKEMVVVILLMMSFSLSGSLVCFLIMERVIAVDAIFHGTSVKISRKVDGIYWHYGTGSHALDLTTGYCNTRFRDWYQPITSKNVDIWAEESSPWSLLFNANIITYLCQYVDFPG